jgi:hypothetical protein
MVDDAPVDFESYLPLLDGGVALLCQTKSARRLLQVRPAQHKRNKLDRQCS